MVPLWSQQMLVEQESSSLLKTAIAACLWLCSAEGKAQVHALRVNQTGIRRSKHNISNRVETDNVTITAFSRRAWESADKVCASVAQICDPTMNMMFRVKEFFGGEIRTIATLLNRLLTKFSRCTHTEMRSVV